MKSFLKGRLEGYGHPVRDDLWASIENGSPAKPKRPIKYTHLISTITGAAAMIVLAAVISRQFAVQPVA